MWSIYQCGTTKQIGSRGKSEGDLFLCMILCLLHVSRLSFGLFPRMFSMLTLITWMNKGHSRWILSTMLDSMTSLTTFMPTDRSS